MKKEFLLTEFSQWFAQSEGKPVVQYEQDVLNLLLPQYYGFYLLQLGILSHYDLKAASMIRNHIKIGRVEQLYPNTLAVEANLMSLPLQYESIDVIVAPHVLECCTNPAHLLNEIYNILIPGGKVVIFGFNPYSFWGVTKVFKPKTQMPWAGNFHSLGQVKFWLNSVGFQVQEYKRGCYRPPLRNESAFNKLLFLESFGQAFFPFLGGVYCLVAEKKIAPLTPLRLKKLTKKIRVSAGYPEPSASIK